MLEYRFKCRILNVGTSKEVPHVKCWNINTSFAC